MAITAPIRNRMGGQKLPRGFESLSLRHKINPETKIFTKKPHVKIELEGLEPDRGGDKSICKKREARQMVLDAKGAPKG